VMQRQRTLAAIVALGILIVSPIAWGCEGADMKSCSMSDCPMSDMQEVDGCHEPTASSTQSFNCESGHQVLIACCDAPVDQEQAQVAAATFLKHGSTPLLLLPENVELHPPSRPPDSISQAISSQQHELGRFTLLSSFLL